MPGSRALVLDSLALIALFTGDCAAAEERAQTALRLLSERGDKFTAAEALRVCAAVAAEHCDHTRAATLWGAADAVRDATGGGEVAVVTAMIDDAFIDRARRADAGAFAANADRGRRIPFDAVVQYAVDARAEDASPLVADPASRP